MDLEKLTEMIDQERWLLNNGLITDHVKNQLFFFGSIVHTNVQAVEVQIQPESKSVDYIIYVDKAILAKIEKYKKLSTATSLFDMWKFKRFLKKEGSLDFRGILNTFVTDFCGPKWSVKLDVRDFDVYVDNIGEKSETDGPSQQPNKLPD
jgi:hypothetical protein